MADNRQTALVVLHPFGEYAKGQIVTDSAAIDAIRQNGQMAFVVATQLQTSQGNSSSARRDD